MPIRVLFTSLKHKLSVVQSSSKNLDLSRLLLCVISCDSVIEMYHAALANQRPENQRATNEKRDKARCFSLWLYKILWEVAILRLDCTSSRARAYSFTFILNRKERGESVSPGLTSYDVSPSQTRHELWLLACGVSGVSVCVLTLRVSNCVTFWWIWQ